MSSKKRRVEVVDVAKIRDSPLSGGRTSRVKKFYARTLFNEDMDMLRYANSWGDTVFKYLSAYENNTNAIFLTCWHMFKLLKTSLSIIPFFNPFANIYTKPSTAVISAPYLLKQIAENERCQVLGIVKNYAIPDVIEKLYLNDRNTISYPLLISFLPNTITTLALPGDFLGHLSSKVLPNSVETIMDYPADPIAPRSKVYAQKNTSFSLGRLPITLRTLTFDHIEVSGFDASEDDVNDRSLAILSKTNVLPPLVIVDASGLTSLTLRLPWGPDRVPLSGLPSNLDYLSISSETVWGRFGPAKTNGWCSKLPERLRTFIVKAPVSAIDNLPFSLEILKLYQVDNIISLPPRLRELMIHKFNKIQCDIPDTVGDLTVGHMDMCRLPNIPPGLVRLCVFAADFNESLCTPTFEPKTLKMLKTYSGPGYPYLIGMVPDNIETLRVHYWGSIAERFVDATKGRDFAKCTLSLKLHTVPSTIESWADSILSSDLVASNITKLQLSVWFNSPIENFVKNMRHLEILKIGKGFHHPIMTLPRSIKIITVDCATVGVDVILNEDQFYYYYLNCTAENTAYYQRYKIHDDTVLIVKVQNNVAPSRIKYDDLLHAKTIALEILNY